MVIMIYIVMGLNGNTPIKHTYEGFELETIKNIIELSPQLTHVIILDNENNVVFRSKDEEYRQMIYSAIAAINELNYIPDRDRKYFDKVYIEELKQVFEKFVKGLTR